LRAGAERHPMTGLREAIHKTLGIDSVPRRNAKTETSMLRLILTSLLIVSPVLMLAAPAQAVTTTRYPYCLQGRSSPGWSNCNFVSRAQCRAMAEGKRLTCVANPFYRAHHR
jgi:Protein of unknown function (DUF3551)